MSKRRKKGEIIRLSDRFGVNPSIPLCFWCGKTRNEVVLLGKLPEDAEAPGEILLDYEPCDSCLSKIVEGIWFIEVQDSPPLPHLPPFIPNQEWWPTGRWAVVRREGLNDLEPTKREEILKAGMAVVPACDWDAMGLGSPQ